MRAKNVSHISRQAMGLVTTVLMAACLAGCSRIARAETVTWNPLEKQQAESDTVFMPDFTSLQTIAAGGGFLAGPANQTSEQVADNYEFGPGRFGPGVRGKLDTQPGRNNYVFYPVDGLMPAEEFTLEFWTRADQGWSALTTKKPFFAVNGGDNFLSITPNGERLAIHASASGWAKNWNRPFAALRMDDNRWHSIALTLKQDTLSIYVDGAEAGQISGARFLPIWSAAGIGGYGVNMGGDGVWISDVRISRTARVPGQPVALRSLIGRMTVDAESGRPLSLLAGALHQGGTPEQVRAALSVVRTDKLLNTTPIIQGPPDAQHPSAGHSGRYSYDWEVVDRDLDWYASHGAIPYFSIDSTPSILGGSAPPYADQALHTKLSRSSAFNSTPPSDLNAWATIVGDLIYHIRTEKHVRVPWYGIWNEPGGSSFWKGTLDQYLDLYAVTARAIRAEDPDARIGGPELAGFGTKWIKALIERCAADKLPLDFISFHHYSGDLAQLYLARQFIDAATSAAGLKTPLPIVIGEFNWSNRAFYKTGYANFRQGMWHLRALGAAFTTASLIEISQLPAFDLLIFAQTDYGDPRQGSARAAQLLGPSGEQWAPYNALKGWKQVAGRETLAASADLPPGVSAVAMRDPSTGRIGLALANYGFAQRQTRTVVVTLGHLHFGQYEMSRALVDPRHSSRWDIAEDRPEGAAHNDLETVERRSLSVTGGEPLQLRIELPAWSSTFINIVPAR